MDVVGGRVPGAGRWFRGAFWGIEGAGIGGVWGLGRSVREVWRG